MRYEILNRAFSILLCMTLLLDYSYLPLPHSSAEENPPIPVNPSVLTISGSAILNAENIQSIKAVSIDIKPLQSKAALKGSESIRSG